MGSADSCSPPRRSTENGSFSVFSTNSCCQDSGEMPQSIQRQRSVSLVGHCDIQKKKMRGEIQTLLKCLLEPMSSLLRAISFSFSLQSGAILSEWRDCSARYTVQYCTVVYETVQIVSTNRPSARIRSPFPCFLSCHVCRKKDHVREQALPLPALYCKLVRAMS